MHFLLEGTTTRVKVQNVWVVGELIGYQQQIINTNDNNKVIEFVATRPSYVSISGVLEREDYIIPFDLSISNWNNKTVKVVRNDLFKTLVKWKIDGNTNTVHLYIKGKRLIYSIKKGSDSYGNFTYNIIGDFPEGVSEAQDM